MTSKKKLFLSKLKPSFIHFCGSMALLLFALYVIYKFWYPQPFFDMYVVSDILLLLVLIDVVLGPFLMFIVYEKGKKTLRMDIAVIFFIQIIAFGYGMWNIAEARPSWLILNEKVVYAVSPNMLVDQQGKVMHLSVFEQNWGKPKLMLLPDNTKQVSTDTAVIYQYYAYQAINPELIKSEKIELDKLREYSDDIYYRIINEYPTASGYFPLLVESTTIISAIIFDKDGKVLGIVES